MNGQFDVEQLKVATDILRTQIALFKDAGVSSEIARSVLSTVSECSSVINAFMTLATLRIDETNAYVSSGHKDAASYIAEQSHITKSEASKVLSMAKNLSLLPSVQEAFENGSISKTQASLIATSGIDPTAEAELLSLAYSDTASVLAEHTRRLKKSSAVLEAEEDARKRSARTCRVSTKRDDAMASVFSLLEPHNGAEWKTELDLRRDQVFRDKRSKGIKDSFDQNMADAFMDILRDAKAHRTGSCNTGSNNNKQTKKPRANREALILIDAKSLKRGHRESGEICELAGVGEISVAKALELLSESLFRILVTDGVDVNTITSKSRYWKKEVSTALEFRDQRCCVPGCDQRVFLQKDHNLWFSKDGPTNYKNGRRVCAHHHKLMTTKGFKLVGKPGNWRWLAPGQLDLGETDTG